MIRNLAIAAATATLLSAIPAAAKTAEPPVTLNKCASSYGTIAVVDGDTQGWTKYGLGSPRDLIAALASESGCFTPYSQGSGQAANFLMNVIAGDKEEVDKGISMARTAAVEGLVRSGAASRMLGGMGGLGGGALGMLGGLGGRRKTVAAGIRLLSPASGQTMISGTGEVTKSSISFGGLGAVDGGASSSGYASSNDGKMLVEAFIKAFNAVSAQGASLGAIAPASSTATVAAGAATAVDTKMLSLPAANAAILRSLRAGSALKPTGKRQGLFVEVEDNFGTKGWVSVEDLR
jgi:hypothetical protein